MEVFRYGHCQETVSRMNTWAEYLLRDSTPAAVFACCGIALPSVEFQSGVRIPCRIQSWPIQRQAHRMYVACRSGRKPPEFFTVLAIVAMLE